MTRPPAATPRPATTALGALVAAVGIGAISALVAAVSADAGVRAALDPTWGATRPSLVMAVLDGFGILLPALVVALGAVAASLGLGVARRATSATRAARDGATWLALGAGMLAISRAATGMPAVGAPALGGDAAWGAALAGWLAPVVAVVAFVALRAGLARAARARDLPEEALVTREARTAWNLLVPAMLILLLVAARPLEATVISSLTDKRFASDDVPTYVGLANYRKLLTLRFDTVACRPAPEAAAGGAGACARTPAGAIRWEPLPREVLVQGYRTAWTWDLPVVTAPDRAIAVSALDRTWVRAIWVTLVFTVFSVSLELLLGLFIAMTVHSEFRGRGAMRAVMLVPWAIPTVVSARLWELMLKDTSAGLVNRLLMLAGAIDTPQAWLTSSALQLPSAIMIDVWKTSPFMALLLLAGLQVIPKELYESARVDGANRFREFVSITLPLLRPAIAVALIFRTLDALRVFDLFNVLFGRSEHSMSTYTYEALINNQEAGYASAIGVLIFFLIFGFAVAYVRFLGVNRS